MQQDLKQRTKAFALRIIRLYAALPSSSQVAQVIGSHLLESGTSVGALYLVASRSRVRSEYIAKLEVAQQALEETIYWLELLIEAELMEAAQLRKLIQETTELSTLVTTYIQRAKTPPPPKQTISR